MPLKLDHADYTRIARITERGFRVLIYTGDGELVYGKDGSKAPSVAAAKAALPPETPRKPTPLPHKPEVAKSTPRKRKAERE